MIHLQDASLARGAMVRTVRFGTLALLAIPRSARRADGVRSKLGLLGDGQRAILVAVAAACGQRGARVGEDGDCVGGIQEGVENDSDKRARDACSAASTVSKDDRKRRVGDMIITYPDALLRLEPDAGFDVDGPCCDTVDKG